MHNLDSIFNPQRIALVGVTTNPNSVGGKVLSNLVGSGFRGVVYPVNPDYEAVLGIQAYPNVKSLPKVPDLAVICTPAADVPNRLKECGEHGIKGIIIMSAGFKEAGEEGVLLEEKIKQELKQFKGMRIIGPNCLGIIAPHLNLNVSFANGLPKKGSVAFISQSGALCTSVLDWAIEQNIGFSHFVSIGNTLDVGFGDLIDYFGEDEKTESILLYIESISSARKFMTAARAFARSKPIIAYKAGRFPESAKAAASHTGAMASEDAVYEAAFKRIGISRVFQIGDLFDTAELIGKNKTPKGSKLAIVTNAGGPGVMAVDALLANNGRLAKLSDETIAILNQELPAMWSHGNPVDVLGDARAKRIAKAVKIVLEDKGVDAVLVILTPQAMTNPTATAKEISLLANENKKPVLAAWLGGLSMREGINILNENKIATYSTPEQAVRAFMTLVSYAKNLESLYETPKDIPVQFKIDRKSFRKEFQDISEKSSDVLSEQLSKHLIRSYGIPVSMPVEAYSEGEVLKIADELGFPVVLKILSPDITHKTDVGGVELNLEDAEMVSSAYKRITQKASVKRPDAKVLGVTVQPMIKEKDSIELILGIKKDPVFGTVVLIGLGGVTSELFFDRSLGFPPLNERLAIRMLESLKIYPVLRGYRGKPAMNMDKLIEVIIRLSYLAADYPELMELDINPLLVTPNSVTALDARIIIDKEAAKNGAKDFSHLALHPYPEEYVKTVKLKDGKEILLRPIKPEDEPMWMDLLGSCSKESLYSRFRYFFHWATHDVAVRYCYIDYDREIAIVAETEEKKVRKLIGVGRLIADPDHETVEYAVLISDSWQNKEIGSILTDYCLDIAKRWDIKRIVAQTTTDNRRMISVFKKRGFDIKVDDSTSLVEVTKIITN